jgi:hypothetical protein
MGGGQAENRGTAKTGLLFFITVFDIVFIKVALRPNGTF